LHPDQFRPHRDDFLDQSGQSRRLAKHVDDVDRSAFPGRPEIGMDGLAQDRLNRCRPDRNDGIPNLLEVARNRVALPLPPPTQSHKTD
jgi:hypothetical protein